MKNPLALIALCLCAISCTQTPTLEDARKLAHTYIIADGHVDLPYRLKVKGFRLEREYEMIGLRTPTGDFDYERAKAGGLSAPFMSIYLPSSYQLNPGSSKALADTLINMVLEVPRRYPDKFAMAYSPADIRANFAAGKISLPMGMENGSGIEDNLANVAYFHQRGIRYITLTHGKDNLICDSSYDTTRTWNGLSPFGEQVVREMNRVGIMVDISHVSDSAFFDVMRVVEKPVIASHSSCRIFTPGFERNMNDDMIRALGKNGGVIMINFGSTFLDSVSRVGFDSMEAKVSAWMAKDSVKDPNDSLTRIYQQRYVAEYGSPFSSVSKVADHIDHVVQLIGIDHVGIGSDFDGVGNSLPTGLKDVADYPNLILELLQRGYSAADIEKICYKNLFRVWEAVEG